MVDPAAWGDHQFALPLKQVITLCSDTKSLKNNLRDFPHLCYNRHKYEDDDVQVCVLLLGGAEFETQ
jgi:hypothetical protein